MCLSMNLGYALLAIFYLGTPLWYTWLILSL